MKIKHSIVVWMLWDRCYDFLFRGPAYYVVVVNSKVLGLAPGANFGYTASVEKIYSAVNSMARF
jgi:hypothetical protein